LGKPGIRQRQRLRATGEIRYEVTESAIHLTVAVDVTWCVSAGEDVVNQIHDIIDINSTGAIRITGRDLAKDNP